MEEPGIDGTTIVEWFFEKWDGDHDLDISGSGQGQVVGRYECGSEPSGSTKLGNFLTS